MDQLAIICAQPARWLRPPEQQRATCLGRRCAGSLTCTLRAKTDARDAAIISEAALPKPHTQRSVELDDETLAELGVLRVR